MRPCGEKIIFLNPAEKIQLYHKIIRTKAAHKTAVYQNKAKLFEKTSILKSLSMTVVDLGI